MERFIINGVFFYMTWYAYHDQSINKRINHLNIDWGIAI